MKIREWFKDKWAWLLTFNNPPEVKIEAVDIIFRQKQDTPVLKATGRVNVSVISYRVEEKTD